MSFQQALIIFGMCATTWAQYPYQGQSAYLPESNNYVYSGYNSKVYSLPSMVVPVPCQAYVLREQMNYICAHGKIWCLPGWKVSQIKSSLNKNIDLYLGPVKSHLSYQIY